MVLKVLYDMHYINSDGSLMGSLGLWTRVGVTVEVRLHRFTVKKALKK
jgi:hypothetical protein